MVHKHDTMPGAVPTRISDDQEVAVDPRAYVATGAGVSSHDRPAAKIAVPPQVTLPVRAAFDAPDVSHAAMQGPAPAPAAGEEHPVVQSALRLCRLLDVGSSSLLLSEIMILQNDARMLSELARLAEQRLDDAQASNREKKPAKTAVKAKKTSRKRATTSK